VINLADNPDFLAQAAHVGWGAALTLILTPYTGHWQAAVYVIALSAGKEAIESLWGVWEPKQPWGPGGIDFAFWLLGVAMSWL
jgi:hypothetical protein